MEWSKGLVVIGAGQMGGALIEGIARAQLLPAASIRIVDLDRPRVEALAERLGVRPSVTLDEADFDAAIVAVKPQALPSLLPALQALGGKGKCFISIAAGVRLERLSQILPQAKWLRAMPNLPARIGKGVTALAAASDLEEGDWGRAEALFRCVGTTLRIDESLFDVVTALSGSGPAYVFALLEAQIEGAVRLGLPRPSAEFLAKQTLQGAAALALQESSVSRLREEVTSPGGTTAAGLFALEERGFRHALMLALEKATKRSEEIARWIDSLLS